MMKHEQLVETANYLKDKGFLEPEIGLILGSGLGDLADEITNPIVVPYSEIPHFPISTVKGHKGQLVYGELSGKTVIAMQGRFHFYEGYPIQEVTLPIRVMKLLGVHSVGLTNAAGGVNIDFSPGDLMLIQDHINFTAQNPLIGPNDEEMGPRFPDMSQTYDSDYQEKIKSVAKKMNVAIKEGVYMGFSGPTYETPAEIKMARTLGADAVGMSTVPEAIVARHSDLRVFGISCITNLAAGMQTSLNHQEVVEVSKRVNQTFKTLLKETLKVI
ncbi:purine-nucleoside phosphorylase [Jeotgalibaca ciconiae]|uniref:Purine nucleoside phosphorylase n=1 Tax=Jeotgalibaca ciconiae TaxID=2496265 RepID=A0A3Q9BME4_9LACT|nr:purine-nucleoside phosphorylase [Jeotgalibaca ciconiae]AZP05296.1 purine-nucleoside phosphorylase [Jeotgalibaca ciconiae]